MEEEEDDESHVEVVDRVEELEVLPSYHRQGGNPDSQTNRQGNGSGHVDFATFGPFGQLQRSKSY